MLERLQSRKCLLLQLTLRRYGMPWREAPVYFPFHDVCYRKIIPQVVASQAAKTVGHQDPEMSVDTDVLYQALLQLYPAEGTFDRLDVDYGDLPHLKAEHWVDGIGNKEVNCTRSISV